MKEHNADISLSSDTPNTCFLIWFNKIENKNDINIVNQNPNNIDELDKMVSEGHVDFAAFDSDRAFTALKKFDNLTIVWPISEVEIMGWDVNKHNPLLEGILEKYIKCAEETGRLDKHWKIYYVVTYVENLDILNLEVTQH